MIAQSATVIDEISILVKSRLKPRVLTIITVKMLLSLRNFMARVASDADCDHSPVAKALSHLPLPNPVPFAGLPPSSLGSVLNLESPTPSPTSLGKLTTAYSPSETRTMRATANYNAVASGCEATFGALGALHVQVQILFFGVLGNNSDYGFLHLATMSDTVSNCFVAKP